MSISVPTVIVLGAGASAEYQFPLGANLLKKIGSALDFRIRFNQPEQGDREIFDALWKRYVKDGDVSEFNNRLAAASDLAKVAHHYPSIDEAIHFFSDRPEVIEVGKLAIARHIISSEQASGVLLGATVDSIAKVQGWMPRLFSMIVGSLSRAEIVSAFRNLTVINFNYDRSFDWYLYLAVRSLGLSQDETFDALSGMNIVRPYGSLGPLPWQKHGVEFGNPRANLFEMAEGLRTYTERGHTEELLANVQSSMHQAGVVLFLGFGFHRQNLEMLQVRADVSSPVVFATAFGEDEANYEPLRRRIARLFRTPDPSSVFVTPLTCSDLFTRRRPAISLALTM